MFILFYSWVNEAEKVTDLSQGAGQAARREQLETGDSGDEAGAQDRVESRRDAQKPRHSQELRLEVQLTHAIPSLWVRIQPCKTSWNPQITTCRVWDELQSRESLESPGAGTAGGR